VTLATFSDPGGLEATSDYSAAVSWGDGTSLDTTSPEIVDNHDGTYGVQAHHVYTEESNPNRPGSNPYSIVVSIQHDAAPVTTAGATAAVADLAVVLTQNGLALTPIEGQDTGTVTLATFTDPGGLEVTTDYRATVNWGDHTALDLTTPTVVDNHNGTYSIRAHHLYTEESGAEHAGSTPYQVVVMISHDVAPAATANDTASVTDPPIVLGQNNVSLTAAEGKDTGLVTMATFTDPGGAEATSDYTVSIDWGDGTPLDTTTPVVSNVRGTFFVQAHHAYAEESSAAHPGSNPYRIKVSIKHESSAAVIATDSAKVSDPAIGVTQSGFTLAAVEGQDSGLLTLATFTDPGGLESPPDYSATVNWGDGTPVDTTTPVIVASANGTYSVQAHHTYTEDSSAPRPGAGPFLITVLIHHEAAIAPAPVDTITVSDPPVQLVQSGLALGLVEGQDSGVLTLATFMDPGGPESVSDYAATVNWGDGTALDTTPVIVASGGTFSVEGHHTYAQESSADRAGSTPYHVVVSITHDTAPVVVAGDSVTVSDPPIVLTQDQVALTSVEGQDSGDVTLATFFEPGGLELLADYSATVDWGDQRGVDAATPTIVDDHDGTYSVHAHHSYRLESSIGNPVSNPYQVVVTINHEGAAAQAHDTAVVTDPAVQIVSAGASLTGVEGQDIGALTLATFRDLGGAESSSDYTAAVDWGDRTGLDTTTPVIAANPDGTFSVLGHHTYAEESGPEHPGSTPYEIAVTIGHESAPVATAADTATIAEAVLQITSGNLAIAAVEGRDTGQVTLARFTDPAGLEVPGDYTPSVDWGDGTPLDTTTPGVVDDHDGTYSVQADHTYVEEGGSYTITVTIGHATPVSTAIDTATVADPAVQIIQHGLSLATFEGRDPGLFTLATFSDPGGAEPVSDYTASVDWGDGTPLDTKTAMIVADPDGTYRVLAHHAYAEESSPDHAGSDPYTLIVTIGHDSAPVATVGDTVRVFESPLQLTLGGIAIRAVEGQDTGPVTLATFTDAGGLEGLGDYTATVS
jgi:hypothetical protein